MMRTPEGNSEEVSRVRDILESGFTEALALAETNPESGTERLRHAFDQVAADIRVELEGLEFLRDLTDRPFILAANHPGFSDAYKGVLSDAWGEGISQHYAPPLYMMVLDSVVRQNRGNPQAFITRSVPMVEKLIAVAGYVPVRDGEEHKKLNDRVEQAINQGKTPVICPEGNFFGKSEDDETQNIGPLQKGIYGIARHIGGLVVPMSLTGFNTTGTQEVKIQLAPALDPGNFSGAEAFVSHMRGEVFGEYFGFNLVEERPV